MTETNKASAAAFLPADRVTSIDFFRGLTMFLLIGESTHLYSNLNSVDSVVVRFFATQLSHHEWNGLHFWDLIQPFFMFIVGVAIPFSVTNRLRKGATEKSLVFHAVKRSLLLLFLGWLVNCIKPGEIVFRFQNVLAQLSVTYLAAFLLRNKSFSLQLIFTLVILLITDLLYRYFPVEGFNHPWVPFENFGAWVNNKIEGVDSTNIWATFNAVPTTAHTIWGALCGKLLMSSKTASEKIRIMIAAALAGLIIGYSLDIMGITPIIKKISTASFVFASGGWAILGLAFSYWLIDVKKLFITGSRIFLIVGMNCIFIYLFFMVGGAGLISNIVAPLAKALFSAGGETLVGIMKSLVVWASLWYICFWLYRNKLFIRI